MTTVELKLVKKWFTTIDAAKTYATQGRIVFDKKHKVICVDGEVFGAKVADVAFDNNVLTISYRDGTLKKLDFSTIADALKNTNDFGSMAVFSQIQGLMGVQSNDSYPDYTGTHYIQGNTDGHSTPLREADRILDQAIKDLANDDYEYRTFRKTVAENEFTATYAVFRKKHADPDTSVANWDGNGGEAIDVWSSVNGNKWIKCGESINIPKDYLVKSAALLTVVESNPQAGQIVNPSGQNWTVGDKILDFVINTKENGDSTSETDTHIYINVNQLMDSYTGDTANVISNVVQGRPGGVSINIDQTNNRVSGDLNNNSIQGRHIMPEVVTIPSSIPELKNTDVADDQPQTLATIEVADAANPGSVTRKEIKAKIGIYWTEWTNTNEEPASPSNDGN